MRTPRISCGAGVQPVCRFYAAGLINSHYYTASANECQFVQQRWPGIWNLESPAAFFVQVPDSSGNCPAETLPVYASSTTARTRITATRWTCRCGAE
jgi:hypothetical protein